MFRLFLSAALLLLAAKSAGAQQPQCYDPDGLVVVLKERFGETEIAHARETRSLVRLFVDPEDGSWTVVRHWPGIACIIAAGKDFTPGEAEQQQPQGQPL